jgi:hypothetical protein
MLCAVENPDSQRISDRRSLHPRRRPALHQARVALSVRRRVRRRWVATSFGRCPGALGPVATPSTMSRLGAQAGIQGALGRDRRRYRPQAFRTIGAVRHVDRRPPAVVLPGTCRAESRSKHILWHQTPVRQSRDSRCAIRVPTSPSDRPSDRRDVGVVRPGHLHSQGRRKSPKRGSTRPMTLERRTRRVSQRRYLVERGPQASRDPACLRVGIAAGPGWDPKGLYDFTYTRAGAPRSRRLAVAR